LTEGIGDMMNPSSVVPRDLEYLLGLMDKQSKRLAELGRFLPFADQQEEMSGIVSHLNVAARYLRWHLSGRPSPVHGLAAEKIDQEAREISIQRL
jgi:hypothetical protein